MPSRGLAALAAPMFLMLAIVAAPLRGAAVPPLREVVEAVAPTVLDFDSCALSSPQDCDLLWGHSSSLNIVVEQAYSPSLAQHRRDIRRKAQAPPEEGPLAGAGSSEKVADVALLKSPLQRPTVGVFKDHLTLQASKQGDDGPIKRLKAFSLIWKHARVNNTANVMLILLLLGVVVLVFLLISTGSPRSNVVNQRQQTLLQKHQQQQQQEQPQQQPQQQQPQQQQQQQAAQPATMQNSLWKDLTSAPTASEATVPGRLSVVPHAPAVEPPAHPQTRMSLDMSPRPSMEDPPMLHMCSQLVVPQGQECTLMVPRLPATGRRSGEVSVCDLRGVSVFGAKYGEGNGGKVLTLFSASSDTFSFGYCRQAKGHRQGAPPAFTIHSFTDKQFGLLSSDTNEAGSSFTISTQRGCWLKFKGDLRLGNLNAMDEQSRLLAIAEPEYNNSRRVRIGPHVDAGLIALAMMGIDLLEHQALKQ